MKICPALFLFKINKKETPFNSAVSLIFFCVGDCDFETGLCGWKDYSHGKFKWASHQGDTMGKIGPPTDHTTNSIKGKSKKLSNT